MAVLTGAGGTFCAGMDLKAFLAGERPSLPGWGLAGFVERPPAKPLIAAVEGAAVAGGFEIALACDLIVAAENARFGLPEVRRGLVAAGGGLLRLPRHSSLPPGRRVGPHWRLRQRGRRAQRPASLAGHPARRGLGEATELARRIARNGPLAVAASKRILVESADWPIAEAFERQRAISEPVRASQDAREGALAFVEKREPRWRGQ